MTDQNVVPYLKTAMVAGSRPTAIVPTTLDEVFRLGQMIYLAKMAPYGADSPEKICACLMVGLEVGMPPMMALNAIAIINGRPSIMTSDAVGLAKASGELEEHEEYLRGEGENREAICTVKRKGMQAITRTFSVKDAKTAGLWQKRGKEGKDTPWITHPDRMLLARARGFAMNDRFKDVLRGVFLREEQEDVIRQGQGKELPSVPSPPQIETAPDPHSEAQGGEAEAPPSASPPASEPEPEEAAFSAEAMIAEMRDHLSNAQSLEDVDEIEALYIDDINGALSRSDREACLYDLEAARGRLSPKEAVQEPEEANAAPEPPRHRYDPFLIPETVTDGDTYLQWLSAMCAGTKTADMAALMMQRLKETAPIRKELQVNFARFAEIRREIADKCAEFKVKS